MPRALLIVLDSVGIGGAPDAASYGDEGANTLGHIAHACAQGRGDREGLRSGALRLPNLARFGLGLAMRGASGEAFPDLEPRGELAGFWGHAVETSQGKDTPSGHWEIAGQPVGFAWGYFPDADPAFPPDLTQALIEKAGLPGILGNRHASGVQIIEDLGAEHLRTGMPICYTSVDSVLQIAAHEDAFGLERLYETCRIARELCDPLRIGRVIARPFLGDAESGFTRTGNRRDFSIPPADGTLLDKLADAGREIVTVGKIGDIFAHRSTGREIKPKGNEACVDAAVAAMRDLADGGLVFVNLVDFDTEHGHRRDVAGYAAALEAFDRRIPEIEAVLVEGDICIVTADHGNDPTWRGTDHTREQAPIIGFGPAAPRRGVGRRESFADIGASIAEHLRVPPPPHGRSFLDVTTAEKAAECAAARKSQRR